MHAYSYIYFRYTSFEYYLTTIGSIVFDERIQFLNILLLLLGAFIFLQKQRGKEMYNDFNNHCFEIVGRLILLKLNYKTLNNIARLIVFMYK